jgi:hypothetical protein
VRARVHAMACEEDAIASISQRILHPVQFDRLCTLILMEFFGTFGTVVMRGFHVRQLHR